MLLLCFVLFLVTVDAKSATAVARTKYVQREEGRSETGRCQFVRLVFFGRASSPKLKPENSEDSGADVLTPE
jgi:hypothetical protein